MANMDYVFNFMFTSPKDGHEVEINVFFLEREDKIEKGFCLTCISLPRPQLSLERGKGTQLSTEILKLFKL